MAFLMNIAMDNTVRLPRRTYLFEYKGVRFKLVQNNPREHHDHLLTIVPRHDSREKSRVFKVAAEFVSALAWETGAAMTIADSGGSGWPDNRPLRFASPRVYGFPRVPFAGHLIGGDLYTIPHVENDIQRIALALFREARASNSLFLSFLFYWQSMEVQHTAPQAVIEMMMKKNRHRVRVDDWSFSQLPLNGRKISDYLYDDCRHAIAHIKRKPGKRKLDLDDWEDLRRFAISVRVVETFAESYIKHHLGMSKKLLLVRPRSGGFPRFADEATRRTGRFVVAASHTPPTIKKDRPFRFPKQPSRRYW
jgi:hypothetical protein